MSNLMETVHDIVDNLSDTALKELVQGSDLDITNLIDDLLSASFEVLHAGSFDLNNLKSIEMFQTSFDETMKRASYNYFKTTMLPNFDQGWRNIEWGNMVQLYNFLGILASRSSGKSYEFCFAWPLWRMWKYEKPTFFDKDTIDNRNSKETIIITNETRLAKRHMNLIAEEITYNSLLYERLFTSDSIGKEKITAKNGASVEYRTYGGFIRGLHVGGVAVDDFPDESCLYSKDRRDKYLEIFNGSIVPVIEPGGSLIVSGTPYHEQDLYQILKKDKSFHVFEYPVVFPNGDLLAPERKLDHSFIKERRESLGTIVFSREFMVTPVSDSSSLFPWEYLEKSFIGMENTSLVENIESYPVKLNRVVVGCDFARSGNIGADYSCFSVWGTDSNNQYYLLHIWRKKGASHREQVDVICRINQLFKANKIIAENNGFQQIMVDLIKERGVKNIEPFTTTSQIKKNLYEGLPSLSAMFERADIKIPFQEGKSKETALLICGEFNSVTFSEDTGRLESAGEHDDCVMSTFFAIQELRSKKSRVKVDYV